MAREARPDHLTLPEPHRRFWDEASSFLPADRMMCDPFRTLALGTDASFYRLVPKLAVRVREPTRWRASWPGLAPGGPPVTFRAAGTSLSGQSITDSVLVVLAGGWRGGEIEDGGARIGSSPASSAPRPTPSWPRWGARSAPTRPPSTPA